jgi:hypothetical protein
MCETFKNGALVSKIALEYMNPEQNVFAAVYTTPPAAQPAPVQEEIDTAYRQGYEAGVAGQQHYIDALKAKLKEKNNG